MNIKFSKPKASLENDTLLKFHFIHKLLPSSQKKEERGRERGEQSEIGVQRNARLQRKKERVRARGVERKRERREDTERAGHSYLQRGRRMFRSVAAERGCPR